ncbi:MAG TPA: phosphoglycerate kinase [Candidatus Thermoplasmatota archaeon]|nr:phosphoglycerate kinase [Candidatus Thermoplasmatota archaeon]
MMEVNSLDDISVTKKTVFLRVDFNMPLDKKTLEILDTTRMKRVLPTIKELVSKQAKTVIIAHQGRKGSWDFTSLKQHAKVFEKILGSKVSFVEDIYGKQAQQAIKELKFGEVLFLDNVRKLEYETEKKPASEHAKTSFIQHLAPLGDVFVNDAFAAAHRSQCSLIGFTPLLPSCAGRLMQEEVTTLSRVMQNPEKPCVFLFGGAKYSDIMVTIERVLQNNTADQILLTGLPANAFLHAQGYNLGSGNKKALLEEGNEELFSQIKTLMENYDDAIVLPTDFGIEQNGKRKQISVEDLPTDQGLFDIGSETIKDYKKILKQAKTIFLSGPCGVFEQDIFMKGTKEIFTYVSESEAFSIVGGGHTVAAVKQLNLQDHISHISTGGGSLEKFMMGEKLPVLEALKQSKINQPIATK